MPDRHRLDEWQGFPEEVRDRLIMGDLDSLWRAHRELEDRVEADKKDTNDRLAKVLWAFIGLITTLGTAAVAAFLAAKGAS